MMNDAFIKDYNEKLINELSEQGYENLRALDDGTVVGTIELMFTRAIFIGLNFQSWEKRFCFKDRDLALTELNKLVLGDDEPVGYVARRNG
jgi:hypothetical protein